MTNNKYLFDVEMVSIKDFIVPNENFRQFPNRRNHDIALIVLATPVNLNDPNIGTVCLPDNADEVTVTDIKCEMEMLEYYDIYDCRIIEESPPLLWGGVRLMLVLAHLQC